MVCARALQIAALLVVAHLVASLIENNTVQDVNNDLKQVETRRKGGKKSRSTSSSSGERLQSSTDSEGSLGMSVSSSSSSSDKSKRKYKPKSSLERRGWRKWHRKCPLCPEDMVKKWRDRSIKWICGGYQRARRSFKSECMMHYRNCQDGTMFIKIHDHRCDNDTSRDFPRGNHFFYEYGVDSQRTKSDDNADSSSEMSSDFH